MLITQVSVYMRALHNVHMISVFIVPCAYQASFNNTIPIPIPIQAYVLRFVLIQKTIVVNYCLTVKQSSIIFINLILVFFRESDLFTEIVIAMGPTNDGYMTFEFDSLVLRIRNTFVARSTIYLRQFWDLIYLCKWHVPSRLAVLVN